MLMPKRTKHRKVQKGRMKGQDLRGNRIAYGEYGLVATAPCWVKSRQIEAARVAMTRYMKRVGTVWIKIFPDKPYSQKPLGTRMGKGKGNLEGWVAVVRPGRVLFEIAAKNFGCPHCLQRFRRSAPLLPALSAFNGRGRAWIYRGSPAKCLCEVQEFSCDVFYP